MVSPTNRSSITWIDSAMPSTQARHDRFNRAQQMRYERWLAEKDSRRINFCLSPTRNIRHGGSNHSTVKIRRLSDRAMVPPTTASCHPNERTEFVAPKRPLILGRKTSATLNPSPKWPLYL